MEKLQAQIAAAAKKTGISSATKIALIAPSKGVEEDVVPEVEWWDAAIIPDITYAAYIDTEEQEKPNKLQALTSYIEHPVQHHPPGGSCKDTSKDTWKLIATATLCVKTHCIVTACHQARSLCWPA